MGVNGILDKHVWLAETIGHDSIKEDNIRAKEEIHRSVVAQIASRQMVRRMALSVAGALLGVVVSIAAVSTSSASSTSLGLTLGEPVLVVGVVVSVVVAVVVVIACPSAGSTDRTADGRGRRVVAVEEGEVVKNIGRTDGGGGDNGG